MLTYEHFKVNYTFKEPYSISIQQHHKWSSTNSRALLEFAKFTRCCCLLKQGRCYSVSLHSLATSSSWMEAESKTHLLYSRYIVTVSLPRRALT